MDSLATLVVFSDFQCPGCAAFSHSAPALTERFPRLRIVYKHFPLGQECNPSVKRDLHPQSCAAARAAVAAHLQGRFWSFQDALFHADLSESPGALSRIPGEDGLDIERYEMDRASDFVAAQVRRDVDLGIRLGVDATPTVYLNGRRVADPGFEALTTLIGHLLEELEED